MDRRSSSSAAPRPGSPTWSTTRAPTAPRTPPSGWPPTGPLIEAEARRSDLDPDMLEALVFLESAGRPDAVAGKDLESAAGLTQIIAGTGAGLLDMKVDVAAEHAADPGHPAGRPPRRRAAGAPPGGSPPARGRALRPAQGAGRHRPLPALRPRPARARGPGLRRLPHGRGEPPARAGPARRGRIPYAQLYFDSTPTSHRRTFVFFSTLSDGSANYLWRVLAAREIMRLHRSDPAELGRRAELYTAKASAEEVLHPQEDTEQFEEPADLEEALDSGDLRPFAEDVTEAGLRRDPRMGELAPRLEAEPRLYRGAAARGLRPRGLHGAADARGVAGPRAAHDHQHGARRRVPGPAGGQQPRGDAQLLAAHHRVGVRRVAQVPQQAARRWASSTPSTACRR